MKKLTEKQQIELQYHKDYSLFVINFLSKNNGQKSDFIFSDMKKVLIKCFKEKNLKALKIISRDIKEWTKCLSRQEEDELNLILESKFNTTQFLSSQEKIQEIVKKKVIENDDEFSIIIEFLNDIENHKKQIDIDFLNQMLFKYEK